MSRTAITTAAAARSNATCSSMATATLQAIDAITGSGNGVEITDFFLHTEPELWIANTLGSDITITIKAGSHNSAIASGMGDKEITIPAANDATSPALIQGIESSRFKYDNEGGLIVEFSTSATGFVWASGQKRGIG